MNKLKSQIEQLIEENTPKHIDLMIPVNQDQELKSLLERILEEERENAQRLKAIRMQLYELESKRSMDYYNYYKK